MLYLPTADAHATKKWMVLYLPPYCTFLQGELSGEEEVRAVVEGRFLSMKAHARELGVGKPGRVLATGGGSNNAEVCACVVCACVCYC